MSGDVKTLVAALRHSHERLTGLVGELDADAVTARSYADDWSIAQVCSHLGSGAEINLDLLHAALEHREPMGRDGMQAIWDRWNALPPAEQVTEAVTADARYIAAIEALSDEQFAAAHIRIFGGRDFDGAGLLRLRLSEHAFHTWDVAVALDPTARLLPDAVELMIDEVPGMLGYLGKAQPQPWTLAVRTTAPERSLVLRNDGEAVALRPAADVEPTAADGTLVLRAEAFLRLTAGRLDGSNDEGVELNSSTLTFEDLQTTFPGF